MPCDVISEVKMIAKEYVDPEFSIMPTPPDMLCSNLSVHSIAMSAVSMSPGTTVALHVIMISVPPTASSSTSTEICGGSRAVKEMITGML